ncbi:MAG: helix-turn-helix domain-containing protein [Gemmatimonadaceae bacterium]|nr:helix-turn-helix domain-containing protein [Gemmatimonadaceae bacterium]
MTQDTAALYNALSSRDSRFDGVFYIGVTSTGIYCRPICPAKTPKAANCRFFDSAEAAEKASFRPCLRCRPELAPGNAPVDDAHRIAHLIAHRIDEGALDDGAGLERIATDFGWSSRQIRRIVQKELGVSPIELVQTRRLLLAKQLLTETALPIIKVAYASGFSSVRRFNDAFSGRYGIPPTHFRKAADGAKSTPASGGSFTLQLTYRPPFDWAGLLRFLSARALRHVERVGDDAYFRTVQLGTHTGWIVVRHAPKKRALLVELTHTLTPVLPALLGRLRNLFDLSARPDVIAEQLMQDGLLADIVAQHPGLRVPGAFDGFELATRAILGQQIAVKGATTLAGRFVEAFGEPIETPHAGLALLSPRPHRVAAAKFEDLTELGIVQSRARSIIALAAEMASGQLKLEAGVNPHETIERLMKISGIGRWTADYIAMRALRWPDAFPKEDIALRRKLGGVSAARAEVLSQPWRPWRSYATLHLWQSEGVGGISPYEAMHPSKAKETAGILKYAGAAGQPDRLALRRRLKKT